MDGGLGAGAGAHENNHIGCGIGGKRRASKRFIRKATIGRYRSQKIYFFSKRSDKPTQLMKKGFASIGGSVSPMTLCVRHAQAQRSVARSKNENNQCVSRRKLSEIKLKRTDTTLDLSQLAKRAGKEKRKEEMGESGRMYLYPWETELVFVSRIITNQKQE